MTTLQENLLIIFGLLPCMLATWWSFTWAVNKVMGFDLKVVYAKIYENPIAAAILRVGVMGCITWLVVTAYGRIV